MISLKEPEPDDTPDEPAPVNTAVHVADAMIAGSSVSTTEACGAKLGPVLVTVIV